MAPKIFDSFEITPVSISAQTSANGTIILKPRAQSYLEKFNFTNFKKKNFKNAVKSVLDNSM